MMTESFTLADAIMGRNITVRTSTSDEYRRKFRTGYMDQALYSLPQVIDQAKCDLADVECDTLVGTGFSGGIVIPSLALALGKRFVLIRKETDDSHHGTGRLLGDLGHRWIFVDDFVSTGRTRTRVLEKVAAAASVQDITTEYVGDYTYCEQVFRSAERCKEYYQ